MTPHEIASVLVNDMRAAVGTDADFEVMTDAIAKVCVDKFAAVNDNLMHEALTLASEMINKERLALLPDIDQDVELRPIEAVSISGLDIGAPENCEPISLNIDPRKLFIDPRYQRSINERGLRSIRRMIEGWDWNRFQPPSCTYAEYNGETVLKVFDGQHTAIAAASHPDIGDIPIMIHEAKDTAAQAAAFVGQNTGRLNVTALQLHQASLVAGNEDALTIHSICARAGVNILKVFPKKFEPGDTVAVQAIGKLIDVRGARLAGIVLQILAQAQMAPILKHQLQAVEAILTDREQSSVVTAESLIAAISGSWLADEDAAKQIALKNKWPLWKCLAIVWFRKTKKVRPPAGRAIS